MGHLVIPELRLLGGFELRLGGVTIEVSAPGRRLLAFLALQTRPTPRAFLRTYVAGVLWPETNDAKATANLRTTLWRLHALEAETVVATTTTVALAPRVSVDTVALEAISAALDRGDDHDLTSIAPERLSGELLPELWDSWLVFERERLRQISLHALELLSVRLTERGDHRRAVLAALAAVEVEPLRETANRRLVEAHLAEGNAVEAARHYRRYASLLWDELCREPHPSFTELLAPAPLPR